MGLGWEGTAGGIRGQQRTFQPYPSKEKMVYIHDLSLYSHQGHGTKCWLLDIFPVATGLL